MYVYKTQNANIKFELVAERTRMSNYTMMTFTCRKYPVVSRLLRSLVEVLHLSLQRFGVCVSFNLHFKVYHVSVPKQKSTLCTSYNQPLPIQD